MIISLILGLLIGITLGLTGAGGGILAVPALVFGMGWSIQKATPVALIAVAGSAALGAIAAFRKNLVRYKAATLMALSGIPFTAVGLYIAQMIPQRVLLIVFSCVMLIVAIRLLKQRHTHRLNELITIDEAPCQINPDSGKFIWTIPTALLLAGTGATTGLMTGMLGVGGGFVIVPMMRKLTNMTMQSVIATSLMVIALVGVGGIIAALSNGATLPIQITVLFALATAVGMTIGRSTVSYIPDHLVQLGFSYILILVACSMLLKAVLNI